MRFRDKAVELKVVICLEKFARLKVRRMAGRDGGRMWFGEYLCMLSMS